MHLLTTCAGQGVGFLEETQLLGHSLTYILALVRESGLTIERRVPMKKYLIHQTLTLLLVLVSVWFIPTHAASLAAGDLPKAQSSLDASSQSPVGELWRRTELYFGSEKPDGEAVTEAEFEQFIDDEVTPRFPDGLTLLTGYGQFRNSAGVIIEERSMMLILLYPIQMSDASKKIEEIRKAYKDAYDQESVLRVDGVGRVSF
jgi:hypothetical protein